MGAKALSISTTFCPESTQRRTCEDETDLTHILQWVCHCQQLGTCLINKHDQSRLVDQLVLCPDTYSNILLCSQSYNSYWLGWVVVVLRATLRTLCRCLPLWVLVKMKPSRPPQPGIPLPARGKWRVSFLAILGPSIPVERNSWRDWIGP